MVGHTRIRAAAPEQDPNLGRRARAEADPVRMGAALIAWLAGASANQAITYDDVVPTIRRLQLDADASSQVQAAAAGFPVHFSAARGWYSPALREAVEQAVRDGLVTVSAATVRLSNGAGHAVQDPVLSRADRVVLARACGRLHVPA